MWLVNLIRSIVFQTVISGVLVFVLGETIQNFILVPFKKYKETIGKIDNKLKYYANRIANECHPDVRTETNQIVRQLSCDLEAAYKQIPKNLRFLLPSITKISESAKGLIFLSNAGGGRPEYIDKIVETTEMIRRNLEIEELT